MKPIVIVESPFRGDLVKNVLYADCLMFDSIERGEIPMLGHLLYPRVLDDDFEEDRALGIECHIAHILRSDYMVVGMDLGEPTVGMRAAIDVAEGTIRIEYRRLGNDWAERIKVRRTSGFR